MRGHDAAEQSAGRIRLTALARSDLFKKIQS
jgi:hypothetical protein